MSIKTPASNASQTIALVKSSWDKFFPGNTFEYFFLDDHFDQQYKADQRFGQVFGLFTLMAILVACLGLFGLASFTTIQRTKEIGIRKVLGASVPSVVMLIAREFVWLILIALFIATPLTWFLIREWEQNFTMQAVINPLRFLIAGAAVFAFAWITISFLSLRAARENPTKALRTE